MYFAKALKVNTGKWKSLAIYPVLFWKCRHWHYYKHSSTGSKWKKRRRLLTPAFHYGILEDFAEVFQEQAKIFVEILQVIKLLHLPCNWSWLILFNSPIYAAKDIRSEWMDEWVNGWMDEWMNEWMNEWMGDWISSKDWQTS